LIFTTLVTGSTAATREAAIAAALDPQCRTAVILEGLPSGTGLLDAMAEAADNHVHAMNDRYAVDIARIAAGCLCCAGNIIMKVTLHRIIRSRPQRLYIGLANPSHLSNIHAFLSGEPYGNLLALTENMDAG
jgi:hypothetical protein